MKFPGKRKTKHYFPVNEVKRVAFESDLFVPGNMYIVGIDQLIVDIEGHIDYKSLESFMLKKGESVVESDELVEAVYRKLKSENSIIGEFAGGAIGNTLHNFSVLSDCRSIALGAISKNISVGDYAFKYICSTNSLVDFSHLKPVDGMMGRALSLITPDFDRTFVISKGVMNELSEDFVSEDIISNSSALLLSAYSLRDKYSPIFKASLKASELAHKHNVPIVFSLGTSSLISSQREFFLEYIKNFVSVLATNEEESFSLTGIKDPLDALEKILESVDLCLLTVGPKGLYIGAHVEDELKRETRDLIHSKSIPEYNKFEYSRAMLKADCHKPIKVYTHINPYMGGPGLIKNTNGAGDAALSALIHDIVANSYHRKLVPTSPKHSRKFLTYSSIHQVSKYCNRASYEVLKLNSPRLLKGLPSREDSLEEAYWDM